MDVAYDHITESSMPKDDEGVAKQDKGEGESTLNADIQAAYTAFSSSAWGSRIGGFLGNVVKQVRR